jgi:hypothetical protein
MARFLPRAMDDTLYHVKCCIRPCGFSYKTFCRTKYRIFFKDFHQSSVNNSVVSFIYIKKKIIYTLLVLLNDPFKLLKLLLYKKEMWDLPPFLGFANSALVRIMHACSAGGP